ncbi:MAG: insulinase family protein, partial [bacterium]|nr:insulinase family protein [bacterium]
MRRAGWLLMVALAASAQVKLPDYTREVLPNGVRIYVMAKADVPMVTLRAVVRGGAESDPRDKAGLASLTAELLRSGTATRSAEQFSEQLDFIGATFSTSVDEQSTVVRSEFLSKDAKNGLGLFADVVLNPTFPEAEVRKTLARRIDSVKAVKDNP